MMMSFGMIVAIVIGVSVFLLVDFFVYMQIEARPGKYPVVEKVHKWVNLAILFALLAHISYNNLWC